MSERYQYHLDESRLPKAWYNIHADMPVPLQPPLHPGTMEPITPEFLGALFPESLIGQLVTQERYVEIPEPVREIYRLWRPTPLVRAHRLERMLDTPAHIYYKNESVSPVGSHKPNTSVPQAFYNKEAGTKALATETGAGQWGSAMALACSFFDLDLEVFMVKVSYEQKPYRKSLITHYGSTVYASPTDMTHAGRAILEQDPDSPGTLGIAISEAVETAATSGGAKRYAVGSCISLVLLHQTVIGIESLEQMEMAGEYPDIVIGCAGGGSNFAGFAYPFLHRNLTAGKTTRILAVEPSSCPSLTRGTYTFDWGDQAGTTPVVKMHTLGHTFMPPGIHAGGLRYHGMAPCVSALVENGDIEAVAVPQLATFAAAVDFAKAEGIVPAPETAHAIRATIDEALKCKVTGEKKVIVFNLSGHGHFDMMAYDAYHRGELRDYDYPAEKVAEALSTLPNVPES